MKAHRGPVVQRDQRKILFDNEDGEISATNIKDGQNTPHYHLQFFTLEPNSVFLPVLLHAAMVFYVHTGALAFTIILTFINYKHGHWKRHTLSQTNLWDTRNDTVSDKPFGAIEATEVVNISNIYSEKIILSGSGKLTWSNEDGTGTMDIREGDVGSLGEGSVFYIHSNLESHRKKLRIYAMFTNTDESTFVSVFLFLN